MSKRSCKGLPLSEKVRVLDITEKNEKKYAEVAKIYSKNECVSHGIVKKKKKFVLVLLLHFKVQKLWPTCA